MSKVHNWCFFFFFWTGFGVCYERIGRNGWGYRQYVDMAWDSWRRYSGNFVFYIISCRFLVLVRQLFTTTAKTSLFGGSDFNGRSNHMRPLFVGARTLFRIHTSVPGYVSWSRNNLRLMVNPIENRIFARYTKVEYTLVGGGGEIGDSYLRSWKKVKNMRYVQIGTVYRTYSYISLSRTW